MNRQRIRRNAATPTTPAIPPAGAHGSTRPPQFGRSATRRSHTFGASPDVVASVTIEFRASEVAETRELDENTLLDIDAHGNLCGLTLEHARERADIPHITFEQVAA